MKNIYFNLSNDHKITVVEGDRKKILSTPSEKSLFLCENDYRLSVIRALSTNWYIASPAFARTKKCTILSDFFIDFEKRKSVASHIMTCDVDFLIKKIKDLAVEIMAMSKDGSDTLKDILKDLGFTKNLINIALFCRRELHSSNPRDVRKKASLYFFYSINMSKRGLAKLPREHIVAGIVDTYNTLTTEPENPKLCLEAKASIKLAVDTVFRRARLTRRNVSNFFENDSTCLPSFQSTFEFTKTNGGGKNFIKLYDIQDKEELKRCYQQIWRWSRCPEKDKFNEFCRIMGLVEPNKIRPITIQCILYQIGAIPLKELLIWIWKRCGLGTMDQEYLDRISTWRPGASINSVDYTGATNHMLPEATQFCLEYFLDSLQPLLNMEEEMFKDFKQFNLKCADMRILNLIGACEMSNGQPSIIKTSELKKAGYDIKKDPKRMQLLQKNGQLMGNPLSFVLLCTINLASILSYRLDNEISLSLEPPVPMPPRQMYYEGDYENDFYFQIRVPRPMIKYRIPSTLVDEMLEDVIINGDDTVFKVIRKDQDDQAVHAEKAKQFGLLINFQKSWQSKEFFSLNSILFYFHWDKALRAHVPLSVGYLNQAMLYNNNIKNIEGINGENFSSCLEQVYKYGPDTRANGGKSTDLMVIESDDLFETLEGDVILAREFAELFVEKFQKRLDYPYSSTSDNGLGLTLIYPFFKLPIGKRLRSDKISKPRLFPGYESYISDIYTRYINGISNGLFHQLISLNIIVKEEDEREYIGNTNDILLRITEIVERDYEVRFKFFSQNLHENEFSYEKVLNHDWKYSEEFFQLDFSHFDAFKIVDEGLLLNNLFDNNPLIDLDKFDFLILNTLLSELQSKPIVTRNDS
jgi:hypothetical protein